MLQYSNIPEFSPKNQLWGKGIVLNLRCEGKNYITRDFERVEI